MSFRKLKFFTHNKPYIIHDKIKRKEHDSLITEQIETHYHTTSERASAFTSKGSLTLEAAVVVPFFFFAMLSLVCVLEMMSTKTLMRNALCSAGREIGQQAYVLPAVSGYGIKQRIIKNIGEEQIENSLIKGGTSGIDCSNSTYDQGTAEFDLSVK